jgi:hypothetical protein
MIISFIAMGVTAYIINLPLAIYNAKSFLGKPSITAERVLFTIISAFFFSLVITHLTLTLKDAQGSMGWAYYIVGLFLCVPYHMRSLEKVCDDKDHLIDGFGIASSVAAYIVVVTLWSSFFSNPSKAGFLYEISSAIGSLIK